jgi:hypothetical protein
MTSIIKVDNLQNQCGANIINENAGTITIGASGDTIALAAGASQSGFGRSGSVNWDTTPKTANFTAVNGVGYFANTSGGAFTMSLPAGSAGAIVSVADYTNSFQTNALTIAPNGSEKINGGAGVIILSTEGQSLTLVYVDGTEGWKSVQDSTTSPVGNNFVVATGGTVSCCGDYKIHTFTGPGTFTVTSAGNPGGSDTVDYLVVAGGGSGGIGSSFGGGGGAGGFRESVPSPAAWTASPLANPGGALPVSVQGYPITVGAGGASGASPVIVQGNPGNNSIFSTITSSGGGGGGGFSTIGGSPGGSGGGSAILVGGGGGSGNTPPTSPPQGNNGGVQPGSPAYGCAVSGGGGAIAVGASATPASADGGAGATTSISASPTAYAGGGGGGATPTIPNCGGLGGGGAGGNTPPAVPGVAGIANTGGGGGGNTTISTSSGSGGSGIVIIRYKYQ